MLKHPTVPKTNVNDSKILYLETFTKIKHSTHEDYVQPCNYYQASV